MIKQAQQMQAKMAELQEKIESLRVEGHAAGGMIKVTLNGKNELLSIKIDPTLLVPEEAEVLEDLIIAAFNEGKRKAEDLAAKESAKITSGLALPPGFLGG